MTLITRKTEFIPVDAIEVRGSRRALNPEAVETLKESMAKIGLRTPITIRYAPGKDENFCLLVTGLHRLEAAKALGWEDIECFNLSHEKGAMMSDEDLRRWEISENLHRAELTKLERAGHVAEWVRLTENRNSEVGISAQVAPKSKTSDGGNLSAGRPESGINAAVRDLGIDRTEAQRSIKIDAMTPAAKAAVVQAGLDDNQSALLTVARTAPEEQESKVIELAERRRRGIAREARVNDAIEKAEKDSDTEDANLALAEVLAKHIPESDRPAVMAWLPIIKGKTVLDHYRRLTGVVFDNTTNGRE